MPKSSVRQNIPLHGIWLHSRRDGKAGIMMILKKYPGIPIPEKFVFSHVLSIPKYRKRVFPACVDGPGVVQSRLTIAKPLHGGSIAA
jgi:hypothetical protein